MDWLCSKTLRTAEGAVKGRNVSGRPRLLYVDQTMKVTGCQSYITSKRPTQSRVQWRAVSVSLETSLRIDATRRRRRSDSDLLGIRRR